MKIRLAVTTLIVGLFSLSVFAAPKPDKDNPGKGKPDKDKSKYEVIVEPAESTIETGDSLFFAAFLQDTLGNRIDTTFEWRVANKNVGIIDANGVFVAVRHGETEVFATSGRSTGKGHVIVEGDTTEIGPQKERVAVIPRDTLMMVGDSVQFVAVYYNDFGQETDTSFVWSVNDEDIGAVNTGGVFKALAKGQTRVNATVTGSELSNWGHAVVHEDSALQRELERGYYIVIDQPSVVLSKGDSIEFTATLMDSLGNAMDTTFTWSTDMTENVIDESGWFFSLEEEKGFVYATAGSMVKKARVQVREATENKKKEENTNRSHLFITPADTVVFIGDTVTFSAYIEDTAGVMTSVVPDEWRLIGNDVGNLSETGLFVATDKGTGLVQAKGDQKVAVAKVLVVSQEDTAKVDSVKIKYRDKDYNQVGGLRYIHELNILKITGLPFPLNLLNGGELALPAGSFEDGVRLEISLPDMAELIGDTSVSFIDEVIAGISFNVYVNNTLVSPYVFDEPVHLTLPYKPDLMNDLGLTLDDLSMFFYDPESSTYLPDGIENVVLDTAANKIYADILHFSQIVIGDVALCECVPTDIPGFSQKMTYQLFDNYPNPFNPETQIAFNLGGNGLQNVRLSIYNILGQEVNVLIDQKMTAGSHTVKWNGKDHTGQALSSGIYFYKLQTPDYTATKRMILLK